MAVERATSWLKRHPKVLHALFALGVLLTQAQMAIASSQGASGP